MQAAVALMGRSQAGAGVALATGTCPDFEGGSSCAAARAGFVRPEFGSSYANFCALEVGADGRHPDGDTDTTSANGNVPNPPREGWRYERHCQNRIARKNSGDPGISLRLSHRRRAGRGAAPEAAGAGALTSPGVLSIMKWLEPGGSPHDEAQAKGIRQFFRSNDP